MIIDSRRTERLILYLAKYLPEEYTFELRADDGSDYYIGIENNCVDYFECIYKDGIYSKISLISVIEKIGPQRILHEIWSSIQYRVDKYNRSIKQLEELIYGDEW
jgi:hypothetical protein